MRAHTLGTVIVAFALALVGAILLVKRQFDIEMRQARAHTAQGSVLLSTRCGPIEYQESGTGLPMLAVHGSGGGHEPLTYKPPTQADSAPAMPPWVEATMMRLISSDFLFWAALHLARDQVIKVVIATPPELLLHASPSEQARIDAMLANILPVSLRAEGLRSDTAVGKHLSPSPLESIRVPTLIISARDDRYGTYASAQYTASHIAGAKFVGCDEGGHTWVGHDDEVGAAIVGLLIPQAQQ